MTESFFSSADSAIKFDRHYLFVSEMLPSPMSSLSVTEMLPSPMVSVLVTERLPSPIVSALVTEKLPSPMDATVYCWLGFVGLLDLP